MPNTTKINLERISIPTDTSVPNSIWFTDWQNKINSNNEKINTAVSEKIIQVALKSSLPISPTLTNNLYIVYGDSDENNGQYRWTGSSYEKISTQLNYATKAEAEAGADNTKVMTPLRVREFFIANGGESGGVTNIVFQSGKKYYKYTATFATDNFEIPNNLFNPATDVIELIHGGNIPLIKDENYTLVGNLVTFIGYSLDIDDDIHCLITNTAYSYNSLADKPDLSNIVRYSDSEIGIPVSVNADTLAGQLPIYYAKQSDLLTLGELKADKQIMPNGWKTESDLPSSYGTNTRTVFRATSTFGGLTSSVIVDTTIIGLLGIQVIYRANTQPLKFRLVVGTNYTWGVWQEVATTEKVDILSTDLRNGWIINSAMASITKNGNECNINLLLRGGTATANTVVMNIPINFRPTKEVNIDVIWYNSSFDNEVGLINIATNGDVKILKTPTFQSNVLIARSYNLS